MRTHTQRAHWHAQETVAKTLLAAAHAKRRAAQGRLIHVRWPTRRQRAATASWGAALLAPWVGWRGRVLSRFPMAPEAPCRRGCGRRTRGKWPQIAPRPRHGGPGKTLTGCACPPGTDGQWDMVP